jgi:hypothetical protein
MPQKLKATEKDSTLRVEMNAMEEQADNAKARDLYWKPLSWLGTMRPTKLAPYQAVKTSAVSTFFAVCFTTLFLLYCFPCERFTTTIAPCVAFATFGQVRLAKNFDSDSHCFYSDTLCCICHIF